MLRKLLVWWATCINSSKIYILCSQMACVLSMSLVPFMNSRTFVWCLQASFFTRTPNSSVRTNILLLYVQNFYLKTNYETDSASYPLISFKLFPLTLFLYRNPFVHTKRVNGKDVFKGSGDDLGIFWFLDTRKYLIFICVIFTSEVGF